jgi:hypothetical protein
MSFKNLDSCASRFGGKDVDTITLSHQLPFLALANDESQATLQGKSTYGSSQLDPVRRKIIANLSRSDKILLIGSIIAKLRKRFVVSPEQP